MKIIIEKPVSQQTCTSHSPPSPPRAGILLSAILTRRFALESPSSPNPKPKSAEDDSPTLPYSDDELDTSDGYSGANSEVDPAPRNGSDDV